jgi:hypothetical protein
MEQNIRNILATDAKFNLFVFDAHKLEGFYCYILTGFIAVNPNT